MGALQQKTDDTAVAVAVKCGPVKFQLLYKRIDIFHHIRVVVFLLAGICPVTSGVRCVNLITGSHQLHDLCIKEVVVLTVAMNQDHRLAFTVHSEVKCDPVDIDRLKIF